jgi:hypothetical protein
VQFRSATLDMFHAPAEAEPRNSRIRGAVSMSKITPLSVHPNILKQAGFSAPSARKRV